MKKTKHTLLTAMTFTAALQMASASNVNAVPNDNAIPTPSLKYDPAAEDVQDVYGPAPYYGEDPVTTAVSTAVAQTNTTTVTLYGPPAWLTSDYTTSTSTTIERTEIPTLYGPPPAYYYEKGDINGDGSVDVFDVIGMRKMILSNMSYNPFVQAYDANGDNEINIADLVALQNYLLGRSSDFIHEPETTAPVTETTLDTTTTTLPSWKVELLYGPPVIPTTAKEFNTNTTTKKPKKTTTTTSTTTTTYDIEEPHFDPIDTTVQPMYGPPEYFGLAPETLQPIQPKE